MSACITRAGLGIVASCAILACGGGGSGSPTSETAETTAVPSSSSGDDPMATTAITSAETTAMPPSDTTGGPAESTDDADGMTTVTPPLFDQGFIPDAPAIDTQCTKVDFLFVIDNSGSMSSYQANLVANFPAFIDGIQNTLEGVDTYQVGVITTDTYSNNIPGCQNLSSLVVQTPSGACGPYADGENYMTEADDLAVTFSCAASVGTSGSGIERPMQAMVEAVQGVDGGPGQCNDGFLREDSLLVIVIITDEYDGPGDPEGSFSMGDPMSWYDDVVAARGGIPENIVVLSLINYMGGPCPPLSGYDDGVHIASFTQLFGANGFVGGICEPNYGPIFNQAIGVIDSACENFMPPQG